MACEKPLELLSSVSKESLMSLKNVTNPSETTRGITYLRAHGQGPIWWMQISNAD